MRKILITHRIEELAEDYNKKLKTRKQFEPGGIYFDPIARIEKLWRDFGTDSVPVIEKVKDDVGNETEVVPADRDKLTIYLYNVYARLDAGLASKPPSILVKEADRLEKMVNKDGLKRVFSVGGNAFSSLKDIINDRLQYQIVRKWIFPEFVSLIGFKTCVYCNSQYTVTDEHNRGYYQLDHWLPQSKYPYLSICFFNLYPCCGSCNMMKNNDDENKYACFYAEDVLEDKELYRFSVEAGSLARYLLTHDVNELKIEFEAVGDDEVIKPLKEKLFLDDLYQQFKDTAEDVVWKRIAYDRGYKKALNMARLDFIGQADINRFIIGTYDKAECVHKRPLTKLTQDIAKQLGLI